MKKILLVPDSFKGVLSSLEICTIMEERIHAHCPDAQVIPIPVADGGEGSVDAFLTASGGEKVTLPAKGPYFEDIQSFYGLVDQGKTAVIEMAACAGLPLAGTRRCVAEATTYGVGLLIRDAAHRGCSKIILGLGGSATNDFGAGAAAALGVRFIDQAGDAFIPTGGTLSKIACIDLRSVDAALKAVELVTMCDIDNPLYGETGAALVFAPQKGAGPAMARFLDGQLRSVAERVRRDLGRDVAHIPGAGAAGGMGGGMAAFFGSRLERGIETVLDTAHFEPRAIGADLVFTGEGRLDTQSLRGKAVIGVARRAKKLGIPVIALVGDIGEAIEAVYDQGLWGVFSINRVSLPFEQNRLRSRSDLALTMDNLLRFLKRIEQ
ncbi:MAG: glycerate kinase [Spirochaetaceae bacterium]|jgi:glycerate kinase|nr:glycerate kinase [Spirochaetaceae bacterium]